MSSSHMDEVRWGIIGCGDVCEIKSGPAFYKCSGSRLITVMRRDRTEAEDYARRHGVPKWTTDADAVIGDPQVNAVYIATPSGSHCDYALRVAAAGKACYVEKPMARNHAECQRMVEAFKQKGLPLFVAYYRRGMQRFIKAKELIDGGAVGAATGVNYRMLRPAHRQEHGWRVKVEESGGGLFLDVGSHTLDILDYLLGPLTEVRGQAKNVSGKSSAEDLVAMNFTIGAALGTGLWDFASDASEDLIEIMGTDGRIGMSTFGDDPVRLDRDGATEEFPFPRPPHVHQGLVQMIVDELRGRDVRCPSTGESGARTSAVMDEVLKDYYGGREDGFWNRKRT